MTKKTSHTPQQIAYALLRITMGINFLVHGLARIPKVEVFRNWMLGAFSSTILPEWLVFVWASVLPFLETAVGLLLLVGLLTYRATIAGGLIIFVLIFGSCISENWEWAGTQMIYALFFYFLVSKVGDNTIALDGIKKRI